MCVMRLHRAQMVMAGQTAANETRMRLLRV